MNDQKDPMQRLAALRPTEALQAEWADHSTPVWAKVQAALECDQSAGRPDVPRRQTHAQTARRRRFHPSRLTAMAAVAAVAASLVIGIQIVLPPNHGGSPHAAAATLERLAVRAAQSPANIPGPGRYRHFIETDLQPGTPPRILESWTASDGRIWRHDTEGPSSQFWYFPPANSLNDPSPQTLAGLPTNPVRLNSELRSRVSGSDSLDEAVFTVVGDMLDTGYASNALQAAALRVLKGTPHITSADTTDHLGRAAIRITYYDPQHASLGKQSLFFDPTNARLLETQTAAPAFIATYTDWSIVGSVPAVVTANIGRAQPPFARPTLPATTATAKPSRRDRPLKRTTR